MIDAILEFLRPAFDYLTAYMVGQGFILCNLDGTMKPKPPQYSGGQAPVFNDDNSGTGQAYGNLDNVVRPWGTPQLNPVNKVKPIGFGGFGSQAPSMGQQGVGTMQAAPMGGGMPPPSYPMGGTGGQYPSLGPPPMNPNPLSMGGGQPQRNGMMANALRRRSRFGF